MSEPLPDWPAWRNKPDRSTPITAERMNAQQAAMDARLSRVQAIADGVDHQLAQWAVDTSDIAAAALFEDATATTGAADARYVKRGDLTINARDRGAVGDGAHDDTAAIQDALDIAAAAGPFGGGSVFLPAGTYKVSSPITVPQEVAVTGQSYHQTIIKTTATTGHVLVVGSACVISELMIQSSATRASGSHISIEGSQAVVPTARSSSTTSGSPSGSREV